MFRDSTVLAQAIILKSGPEPLKSEIDEILGSKREAQFVDPVF